MAKQTALLSRAILAQVEKGTHHRPSNGRLADGRGLFLQLNRGPGGSWVFRYQRGGKEFWPGLGSFPAVGAAEARERAEAHRKTLRLGGDPQAEVEAARKAAARDAASQTTFGEMAEAQIAMWERGGALREKTLNSYRGFLRNHAIPALASRALLDIEPDDVLAVVEPITKATYQTGVRVRWHIEKVFEYAQSAGVNKFPRDRANPAAIKLITPTLHYIKRPKVEHHAALPWQQMPSLMNRLRANGSQRALALMLVILSGLRSQEVRLARWPDFDLTKDEWKIQLDTMKEGELHIVPISSGMKTVLTILRRARLSDGLLFPKRGSMFKEPMSESSMINLLQGDPDRGGWNLGITVHGFRSSLRDWGAEQGFRDDVMEWVLAHGIPNDATVAAYKRTTFFEKRVAIMEAWSKYCMPDQRHLAAVA
jgi:integrase